MTIVNSNSKPGYFGEFGGQFVPETLMPALIELEQAYYEALKDEEFRAALDKLLVDYVGRPTPLTLAERFSDKLGISIYLMLVENT